MNGGHYNREENKVMEDQCDLSIDEINQEEASLNGESSSKSSHMPASEKQSVHQEENIIADQKMHILTNQLAQLAKPTKTNFNVFNKN